MSGPSGLGGEMAMTMSVSGGVGAASLESGESSSTTSQEYTLRVPRDRKKKLSLMEFSTRVDMDFAKLGNVPVKIERENNLKEYKPPRNLNKMPMFGAGSEFGRYKKEVERRKKNEMIRKQYNPDEQPWLLEVGSGKQAKKYRGVRKGTITENSSYYIFIECADEAYEAFPVEEWYNFTRMIRYKYLSSTEAEKKFRRQDEVFNMKLEKRVKNKIEMAAKGKVSESKKKNKDFMLTDMDDWDYPSDDNEDGEEDDEDDDREKNGEKGEEKELDSETISLILKQKDEKDFDEDFDEDFDGKEVDYM